MCDFSSKQQLLRPQCTMLTRCSEVHDTTVQVLMSTRCSKDVLTLFPDCIKESSEVRSQGRLVKELASPHGSSIWIKGHCFILAGGGCLCCVRVMCQSALSGLQAHTLPNQVTKKMCVSHANHGPFLHPILHFLCKLMTGIPAESNGWLQDHRAMQRNVHSLHLQDILSNSS
jgi:hypothetical protein